MMDTGKMMRMQRDLSRDLDTLNRQENELRRDCETKIAWIQEQRSALIKEYIDKLAEEDEHDQV